MSYASDKKEKTIYKELCNQPIYSMGSLPNLSKSNQLNEVQEITNQKIEKLLTMCISMQQSIDAMQTSINAFSETLSQFTVVDEPIDDS